MERPEIPCGRDRSHPHERPDRTLERRAASILGALCIPSPPTSSHRRNPSGWRPRPFPPFPSRESGEAMVAGSRSRTQALASPATWARRARIQRESHSTETERRHGLGPLRSRDLHYDLEKSEVRSRLEHAMRAGDRHILPNDIPSLDTGSVREVVLQHLFSERELRDAFVKAEPDPEGQRDSLMKSARQLDLLAETGGAAMIRAIKYTQNDSPEIRKSGSWMEAEPVYYRLRRCRDRRPPAAGHRSWSRACTSDDLSSTRRRTTP